jgi:BMFP domain-containing protein YqiC
MQTAALSPLQMMRNFIQSSAPEKTSEPGDELQELRKRLSELEARQRKSKARARPKSAKKSVPRKPRSK